MKSVELFTPHNFDEFIGQSEAKKIAQIVVNAAKIEKRNPPNILIDGEYGLGKTTLAKIILSELGKNPKVYDALAINSEIPVINDTIIIDEIHNLAAPIADSLSIRLDEQKISIIGCTTNPGLMPLAFKSRFRAIHLKRYTVEELTKVLDLYCLQKGIKVDRRLLKNIAERSRFNTRVALNYLYFILDFMVSSGQSIITANTLKECFELLEVQPTGLLQRDFDYLAAFPKDGRAVGVQYLAAKLGVDTETITHEIEPYLMQMGLIDRTQRGRIRVA